jgi:CRP-like cAMP-binding protein
MRSGEDVLLDQLDAGDVLGEIGALGGEPRTASARTATRATLIRIGRRALLEAMDADPELAATIWARYTERRFEYAAETHPALARTSRAERFAFLRRGTAIELAAGGSRAVHGPGLVFVVRGEVAIEQTDARARVVGRAPLLLDVDHALHLQAVSAVHLVELPAPPRPAAFEIFRPLPMLAALPDADLVALLLAARAVRLEGDEPLFSVGDRADAFYFVRAGAVDIVLGDAVIRRLGPGECFGERGLDPGGPGTRTAGARTVGPTELLRVVGDAFRTIAGEAVFGATEPGRPGW